MLQMRVNYAKSTNGVGISNASNVGGFRCKPKPEALDAVMSNEIELRPTICES